MHRPARKTTAAIITVVGVAASAAYAYAVAPNAEMSVGKPPVTVGQRVPPRLHASPAPARFGPTSAGNLVT